MYHHHGHIDGNNKSKSQRFEFARVMKIKIPHLLNHRCKFIEPNERNKNYLLSTLTPYIISSVCVLFYTLRTPWTILNGITYISPTAFPNEYITNVQDFRIWFLSYGLQCALFYSQFGPLGILYSAIEFSYRTVLFWTRKYSMHCVRQFCENPKL